MPYKNPKKPETDPANRPLRGPTTWAGYKPLRVSAAVAGYPQFAKKTNSPALLLLLAVLLTLLPGPALTAAVADFSLKSIDGSTYKISEHLGKKVIVVDFWATWCKPCKKLLKRLDKIYLKHRENVEVLAISVDESSAFAMVESYVKGKGFKFRVLLDPDSSVAKIFNPAQKIPFTVIIDRKGDVVYAHVGYIPGMEKEIEEKIEAALSERTASAAHEKPVPRTPPET